MAKISENYLPIAAFLVSFALRSRHYYALFPVHLLLVLRFPIHGPFFHCIDAFYSTVRFEYFSPWWKPSPRASSAPAKRPIVTAVIPMIKVGSVTNIRDASRRDDHYLTQIPRPDR
jgi:hypothetical protein